ncbi:MAG: Wzz/FepE/Etk N-terminal domain-containing protein [Micropruina sp.]|uniref:O-antigen ligase family protein n=1 Tax=Micropruina sp. TaxID=2737536 RepID=UPI0039E21C0F
MTLGGLLAAIRVRWLTVVLATVLAGLAGVAVASIVPKTYVATATVLLRWIGPEAGTAQVRNVQYVASRTSTYVLLAGRPAVLQRAIEQNDLTMSVGDLKRRIEASSPRDSQLILVNASSRDPKQAALLANVVADSLVEEVSREESRGPLNAATLDAVVVVVATPPQSAATPRLAMYVAVATLIGVSLGIAVAALRALSAARSKKQTFVAALPPPQSRRLSGAHIAWALLVAATIPWRSDVFFDGGADPVVMAKAGISILALGLSIVLFRQTPRRHPVPAAPILILAGYLAVTVVGALANQDLMPSLIVAIRVSILAASVCLLAAVYGSSYAMRSLVHVLGLLVVAASVSGLLSYAGRLRGVLPPLNPNLLAIVTAVVAIWLVAKVLAGTDSFWEFFAIGGCLMVVLLTGSRTGLAAMVLAFTVMLFRVTALRRRTFLLFALGLPAIVYFVLGTDALSSVLERGGGSQVATLSNRTIAWNAALSMDRDEWQKWFGQGLAQKKISVPAQWWDTQLLDSSWISALVQGGYLGVALVVLLATLVFLFAAFSARSKGAVWIGLATFTILGGFLESGLFDGTVQFMVFLVTALGAFGSHERRIEVDRRAVAAAHAPGTRRRESPAVLSHSSG